METRIFICSLIMYLGAGVGYGQEELPDNYLPISLKIQGEKLVGGSAYLEGFTFSMDLPPGFLKKTLDKERLFEIVRSEKITGTLTYPNNKTTEIKYEVVDHRSVEDIYMKTTLGYFLWEMLEITDSGLFFAINWWYCPPAREFDLEALVMAEQLLADSSNWHKMDDRKCENDIADNKWSLFCAIKYASIEKMGEYNHHNTAMQALRFTIDELIPDHGFEHTLMDYNNSPSTTHRDILNVIDRAKKRIKEELARSEGFWEINGTKLHYVIIGQGEPIVVLHGGPGGNLASKLELVSFAPGFQWVFYDQRGCGESERFPVDLEQLDEAAEFFSVDRQVEDLEEIRKKLGLEKITVLGHSWGGGLAAFYAAAHPDRVKKLIVYNGGPIWPELRAAKKKALEERSEPEIKSRAAEIVAHIGENIETLDQNTLDAEFVKLICLYIPAYDCNPSAPPSPDEIGRGGFWANQLTNRYIDVFDRDDFAQKLVAVKAPTLITYGRCEPNPPERQTFLRDAIPNSIMIVFDESGHNAHREQPKLFGQTLRAFLADQPLPLEHYSGEASALDWNAKRTR